MPTIPVHVADRLRSSLKEFQGIVQSAKSRDVNESDSQSTVRPFPVTGYWAEMFCRKCGTKLPDDSQFCPKCGLSVLETSASRALPTGTGAAAAVAPALEPTPQVAVQHKITRIWPSRHRQREDRTSGYLGAGRWGV
jgi:hypothetical protein